MTRLEAVKAIAERNGGVVTPGMVLDEARDEASVLHGAFTWDDGAAAEKWRVHEAQQLIREFRVTIVRDEQKVKTYAFVGLSTDRNEDARNNPYRLAEDVAKAPDLMAVAEADALGQLKAIRNRYSHIKRLAGVWDAIDAAGVERSR